MIPHHPATFSAPGKNTAQEAQQEPSRSPQVHFPRLEECDTDQQALQPGARICRAWREVAWASCSASLDLVPSCMKWMMTAPPPRTLEKTKRTEAQSCLPQCLAECVPITATNKMRAEGTQVFHSYRGGQALG